MRRQTLRRANAVLPLLIAMIALPVCLTRAADDKKKDDKEPSFRQVKSDRGEHVTGNSALERDVVFEITSDTLRVNWNIERGGPGARVRVRLHKWDPNLAKIRDKWAQQDTIVNDGATMKGSKVYKLGPGKYKFEVWCKRAKYELAAEQSADAAK